MLSNGSDLAQCSGEGCHGQRLCRQLDQPGDFITAFPTLIRSQHDTQLICCLVLSPSHTLAPEPQFKSTHSSPRDMQIFRNSPGEILANYEYFALCVVGFYE